MPSTTASLPKNPEVETALLATLQLHFQYPHFRRGQLDILRSVLDNHDALAVMPTGGGKSLCYQIPALHRPGIVIVVSPLIALMRDQVSSLKARGIAAACLHTGQTLAEKQEVFDEMKRAERFLLYLSPERVQKPGFASWIQRQQISLFAIDEAHCVSQWGPEFREDYHRLRLLRELRPEVPILALTASATPQVLRDIARQLELREPDKHIYGFYRPTLFYQVEFCENDLQKRAMLRQALGQYPEGKVLVYCGTRNQCETLVEEFSQEQTGVDYYHAGLETEKRHQVQEDFTQGRTRILFATNAFGMGVDHPDIRLVVHYQMPANIESYYQEMGRAGRDGADATCLLLYSKRDKGLHAYFITRSEAEEQHIQKRWRALDTIVQFAEGGECRHSGILTYFRDSTRVGACGHCDICAPHSERRVVLPAQDAPIPSSKKSKKGKVFLSEALSVEGEGRYQVLKAWRKQFAASKDVPAFLVFSNKTLHDLSQRNPQNLTELARVYGLGPQKIEAFGAELLETLMECASA